MIVPVLDEILAVARAAAPWLLLGLFAAGLIKALIPEQSLQRWVGGQGIGGISRAALIGMPLPLCSCGAIPTALTLYRGGAGRGPTTAFLVGTPGIGVDSIAITYALLGPFMTLVRAAGAVVTAIATGLLVAATGERSITVEPPTACAADGCCGGDANETADTAPLGQRLLAGLRYAFGDLLDDISSWIFIGLIVAGALIALVPPQAAAAYGSGLLPMLLMAAIGIPLYICAAAATPIAASMLLAGVSPGTALVFLLAGPITSMATLGILRREMGNAALACYLLGIFATTILIGLAADQLVLWAGIDIAAQIGAVHELLPQWLQWTALVALILLAIPPLRRLSLPWPEARARGD